MTTTYAEPRNTRRICSTHSSKQKLNPKTREAKREDPPTKKVEDDNRNPKNWTDVKC